MQQLLCSYSRYLQDIVLPLIHSIPYHLNRQVIGVLDIQAKGAVRGTAVYVVVAAEASSVATEHTVPLVSVVNN